jgi:hypothetical protein
MTNGKFPVRHSQLGWQLFSPEIMENRVGDADFRGFFPFCEIRESVKIRVRLFFSVMFPAGLTIASDESSWLHQVDASL